MADPLRLRCSKCKREHVARRPVGKEWVDVVCCGWISTIYNAADCEPRVDRRNGFGVYRADGGWMIEPRPGAPQEARWRLRGTGHTSTHRRVRDAMAEAERVAEVSP